MNVSLEVRISNISSEVYVRKQAPKDIATEEMGEDLHTKA